MQRAWCDVATGTNSSQAVHKILDLSSLAVLRLPLVNYFQGLLGSLDTAQRHGTKGWTHAIGSIDFTQLHTTHDQSLNYLPGPLHDSILRGAHVQTPHAAELLELLHADEALHGKGAEGTVVASGGDDKRSVDCVGVHARLVIVVHRDKGPVGDYTGDADRCRVRGGRSRARDEVLHGSCIEKLNIGEGQGLGEQSRSEEGLSSLYK